jgi:NitT/TauT family transport system substrate-binding protein
MRNRTIAGLVACAISTLASVAHAADPVKVCGLRFTSSAANFIAVEKGYYADEGLDITLAYFDAGQPVAVAVSAGACDIGVTGFTAGMYNLAGQGTLRIIAGEAWEERGYQFIGVVASNEAYDKGLRSIRDLPGKRFGVTQLGSTFHYNVGMLTDKYGWDNKAVSVVPLQSVANMVGAVKSGAVDAAALPSFVANPLSAGGAVKLLGWVAAETPWQVSGVIASKDMIDKRRSVVEHFIKAYKRATAEYDAAFNHLDAGGKHVFGKDAEALFPIIEKYTNTSRAVVMDGLPYVNKQASYNIANVAAQLDWYKARGFVDAGVTVDKVADASFVEVVKENFK